MLTVMREFVVAALSDGTNSFGLRGHVVVDRQGRTYEMGRTDSCSLHLGERFAVEVGPESWPRPQFERMGFELVRQLPDMPPQLVERVWRQKEVTDAASQDLAT